MATYEGSLKTAPVHLGTVARREGDTQVEPIGTFVEEVTGSPEAKVGGVHRAEAQRSPSRIPQTDRCALLRRLPEARGTPKD